LANIIIAV